MPVKPVDGDNWSPPQRFQEYVIEGPLGEGAMGLVFVALDTHLDRRVAIKFVTTFEDPIARARFRNEAKAIARLQHPNVVSVHRVGEIGGRPYLVYELVDGTPLDRLSTPVDETDLLPIALDLARGLAAAHRHGVLHRDIKPSNAIRNNEGVTKLLDFGLAKLTARDRGFEREQSGTESIAVELPAEAAVEALALTLEIQTSGSDAPRLESDGTGKANELTDENALMGTPLFLAPELWRGERASEASDIYSYGAVLYWLATGRPPVQGETLVELSYAAVHGPPISMANITVFDGRLGLLIESCLARNPQDRPESTDAICATLDEITSRGRRTAIPAGNPYRGLLAFQAEHRDLFFGRDVEIASIIERLRVESLVIVAGDSGVGKSSLCRAGVIPEIADGALGGEDWLVRTVVPGKRPMSAIAGFFREALGDAEHEITGHLADEWTDVGRSLDRSSKGKNLLIFIDQLEELVTISDPEEAAQVGALIQRAISPIPEVRIMCTVRSDFLTRVASIAGFRRALSRALYLLPPLSRSGVRLAIEGPASAHGFAFEDPKVVESLCDQVSGTASLPLLQFALAELWDSRDQDRKVISAGAFESIGGLVGALERHADGVLATLRPEQRKRARSILVRLTSADRTRLRKTAEELGLSGDEDLLVLESLVEGRLLVATEGESGAQLEVAHEALLRGWRVLRDWLDEDRQLHALLHRCEDAASEWQRSGRAGDLLWGKGLVERTRHLPIDSLSPKALTFVVQSRRSVRRRRLLRLGAIFAVVASVAFSLLGYNLMQKQRRDREIRAQLALLSGELETAVVASKRVEEFREQALALFDAGKLDEGNEAWTEFLRLARELDIEQLRGLEAAAESTYLLDPKRKRSSRLVADILLQRASLAEQHFQWQTAEGFVERAQRMSNEATRRWFEPVRITLNVTPDDAHLQLERFDTSGHPWDAVEIPSSSRSMELGPGSYRFRLSHQGHASTLLPFEVGRAQPQELRVNLPAADAVPANMVFVPGGLTYLGSDHPEEMRRNLFRTAPMRRREVGSFLISRHEVTFIEYADYLESLDPSERLQRLPRSGLWGPVDFERLGPRRYRFRDGEMGTEELQARENWRQLPLMGISAQDAVAYARWLDRTRKLPGARLCEVHEWVRAARGADRRTYPHGVRLEDGEANTYYKGGRNRSAPVGSYAASISPFGVLDMAGNVFEMVANGADQYSIEGGSYEYTSVNATVVNAAPAVPDARGAGIGLRMCAEAPDIAH